MELLTVELAYLVLVGFEEQFDLILLGNRQQVFGFMGKETSTIGAEV